jgi:hypothetical protein
VVYNDYIEGRRQATTKGAPTTTQRATKAKRKPAPKAVYQGGTLVRVYDKATGAVLGYVAKPAQPRNADGTVKTWYQITCDLRGCWHCTCEGNAKYHRQCMHIDAAMELCEIRARQGRPGCYAEAVPAPVVLPETKEVAALTALALAIPGGAKRDRATAPLQRGAFPGLPPSWDELAERRKRSA